MHCPHCGAILFGADAYCSNCGTLIETLPVPETVHLETGAEPSEQLAHTLSGELIPFTPSQAVAAESAIAAAALEQPLASQSLPISEEPAQPGAFSAPLPKALPILVAPALPPSSPTNPRPFMRFEEVGSSNSPGMFPAATNVYPSLLPVPESYAPGYTLPGTYPNPVPNLIPPGAMPPIFMQPPQKPRRRWPLFVLGMIVGIVITLTFGSVVVGLRLGQPQNNALAGATVATPASTFGTSPTPDPNLLYQQITSQSPTFVDTLQDPTLSRWVSVEKPNYGCKIQSDGLHVYVTDSHKFYYCTSGRGEFTNFAFQVEMKLLTGDGGGILFSSDNRGNEQYFRMRPDGSYEVFTEQNHKFGNIIAEGTASLTPLNTGVKSSVAIIAQNNDIYLYLNRKLINHFQDGSYSRGYVGVGADDNNAPAEVVYTNAQIWMI